MKLIHWLIVPLLSWNLGASAAPPAAGALQPSVPFEVPPKYSPSLNIQKPKPTAPSPQADSDIQNIVVNRLQFTGVELFAPSILIDSCRFVAGKSYSLTELRAMATCIERYYHAHGYPVTQAYLPAQDIDDGALTIAVLEGRYGQVLVRNRSHASADVLADLLQDIKSGDVVVAAPLERRLLLLSDLPAVKIAATLVPGVELGTSDLMVDVSPGPRVNGSIDVDNAGNYHTGALRAGATIFLNEPTGQGDVASLRLLTSGGGLNYLRATYQLQVGQARAGVAFSHLEYALGKEFESLLANGTANSVGLFGSYPLLRSSNKNLYIGASFDAKQFEDRLDAVSSVTNKNTHVLGVSLSGEERDSLGAGGQSSFALTMSSGVLAIHTSAALSYDAATAKTNGQFTKLALSASRLQNLSPSLALFAGLNGQLASKNLDSSEKMHLGGAFAVRSYPEGESYGDEGYVANVELRWLLPRASQPATGDLQLFGFIDTGSIKAYKNPWSSDTNHRQLSGTGVGVNWTTNDKFLLRLTYAHKLGNEAATSAPDADQRVWLQAIKYF